jgi:hypothetical protein
MQSILKRHAPKRAPAKSSYVTFFALETEDAMLHVLYHGTELGKVYGEIDKTFGGKTICWRGTVEKTERRDGNNAPRMLNRLRGVFTSFQEREVRYLIIGGVAPNHDTSRPPLPCHPAAFPCFFGRPCGEDRKRRRNNRSCFETKRSLPK